MINLLFNLAILGNSLISVYLLFICLKNRRHKISFFIC